MAIVGGDLVTTVQAVYIGLLLTDNSYDPVAKVKYAQSSNYESEHDTDVIKATGMDREGLSVKTGMTITIEEAALSPAVDIATGHVLVESGTTPNQVNTTVEEGGGGGKPYVGLIVVYATVNNARFVTGWPKAMLQADPQFEAGQNEFRTGELEFKAFSATPDVNKIRKQRIYENVASLPDFTTTAAFDAFFLEMFT